MCCKMRLFMSGERLYHTPEFSQNRASRFRFPAMDNAFQTTHCSQTRSPRTKEHKAWYDVPSTQHKSGWKKLVSMRADWQWHGSCLAETPNQQMTGAEIKYQADGMLGDSYQNAFLPHILGLFLCRNHDRMVFASRFLR